MRHTVVLQAYTDKEIRRDPQAAALRFILSAVAQIPGGLQHYYCSDTSKFMAPQGCCSPLTCCRTAADDAEPRAEWNVAVALLFLLPVIFHSIVSCVYFAGTGMLKFTASVGGSSAS